MTSGSGLDRYFVRPGFGLVLLDPRAGGPEALPDKHSDPGRDQDQQGGEGCTTRECRTEFTDTGLVDHDVLADRGQHPGHGTSDEPGDEPGAGGSVEAEPGIQGTPQSGGSHQQGQGDDRDKRGVGGTEHVDLCDSDRGGCVEHGGAERAGNPGRHQYTVPRLLPGKGESSFLFSQGRVRASPDVCGVCEVPNRRVPIPVRDAPPGVGPGDREGSCGRHVLGYGNAYTGAVSDLHVQRRGRLRALLRAADLDALLVTDLLNIRYLTGFTGSHAALLVPVEAAVEPVFCTDGRYRTQAAAEVSDLSVVIERAASRELLTYADARPARYRRVGFESQHMSVEQHATLEALVSDTRLQRAPGLVEQLRTVKDESEIESLRAACAAADRALADLLNDDGIRPGRSEREVARDLENRMLDHGSEGTAFPSIVAAGAHAAIPHHRPTGAVLARGDFVKFDFGAVVDGYHSDMSRTFVLGEPAAWQREVYDLVRRAQEVGVGAVVPEAEAAQADRTAREVIGEAGYAECFSHGLGHGVGLQIHEAPRLSASADGRLWERMVVTVEPGLYLEGHGGVRIEDTVVVRDNGPEILTTSTKELTIV